MADKLRKKVQYLGERKPHLTELEYFRTNKGVAGMAASDDKVILNPFSGLGEKQQRSVLKNERARIKMRRGLHPSFSVTEEQKKAFSKYGSDQDVRETIAARIHSGDPSSGSSTKEQIDWVNKHLRRRP